MGGEGRGNQIDWQRESIGGDEGSRAGNRGVIRTDGESKNEECTCFLGNHKG